MSQRIQQSLRDHGLADAIMPEHLRRAIRNADNAIGDDGKVLPPAASHLRTPLSFHWIPSEGKRELVARGGTAVRIGVHCTTPPTSQMAIRIIQETEDSGETIIHTEYIPAGRRVWVDNLNVPILSGSFLTSTIFAPGGASGVSVSLIVNVG